jgi:hypothetical protein
LSNPDWVPVPLTERDRVAASVASNRPLLVSARGFAFDPSSEGPARIEIFVSDDAARWRVFETHWGTTEELRGRPLSRPQRRLLRPVGQVVWRWGESLSLRRMSDAEWRALVKHPLLCDPTEDEDWARWFAENCHGASIDLPRNQGTLLAFIDDSISGFSVFRQRGGTKPVELVAHLNLN